MSQQSEDAADKRPPCAYCGQEVEGVRFHPHFELRIEGSEAGWMLRRVTLHVFCAGRWYADCVDALSVPAVNVLDELFREQRR